MGTARLTIDLNAVVDNWRALDAMTNCETAAVVKANGYGLGAPSVARVLAKAGARTFFVAAAEEGVILRSALGSGPTINVFSGHMDGDTDIILSSELTPMINSVEQMLRHVEALQAAPFGIQLDSGMNRLGMEPEEWSAVRDIALARDPTLIMSHLACADEPDHPMNTQQLKTFREMTDGLDVPCSLAATGGVLLGSNYHFNMTRPGIGLYGGMPFKDAQSVVTLDIPVIQTRQVAQGETVGYGNSWVAEQDSTVVTIAAGYADGLIRAMGNGARLYAGDIQVPVIGRVSMDLITADISHLPEETTTLQLLGTHQSVDDVADFAGTIGYEILTSLGNRYARTYLE
jgi:alanine racemase